MRDFMLCGYGVVRLSVSISFLAVMFHHHDAMESLGDEGQTERVTGVWGEGAPGRRPSQGSYAGRAM
jgi:hypothetical protein